MFDRESILRRGGELELECPDLGSDLMGKNGESKLSYYKQAQMSVGMLAIYVWKYGIHLGHNQKPVRT